MDGGRKRSSTIHIFFFFDVVSPPMAHLFFKDIPARLEEALQAKPTGDNQLSVGLGGDIPIFPPILVLVCIACGFLLKALLPERKLLPRALSSLALRLAVFAALMAAVFSTLQATDAELQQLGHHVNFAAVPKKTGLATGGPFQYSRNPIYAAAVTLGWPALCVVSNSRYLLFSMLPFFLYLQLVVIPAEEEMHGRLFGSKFDAYCTSVPRWISIG